MFVWERLSVSIFAAGKPLPQGKKSDFIGSGLTMSYEYDIFMHIKEMNWRPHENHAQHRG
jgi:hypothetical protein